MLSDEIDSISWNQWIGKLALSDRIERHGFFVSANRPEGVLNKTKMYPVIVGKAVCQSRRNFRPVVKQLFGDKSCPFDRTGPPSPSVPWRSVRGANLARWAHSRKDRERDLQVAVDDRRNETRTKRQTRNSSAIKSHRPAAHLDKCAHETG